MLPFPIKIRPVKIFTGATPGSSLVIDKRVVDVECVEDDSSGGGPASQ